MCPVQERDAAEAGVRGQDREEEGPQETTSEKVHDSMGEVEMKTDEVPEEMETEKGHEVKNDVMMNEEPGQQSAGAAAANGLIEAQQARRPRGSKKGLRRRR